MIREQIAKLINLKTILTLCIALTFMYMTVQRFFSNEQVYTIVFATFSTFLGYQTAKDRR